MPGKSNGTHNQHRKGFATASGREAKAWKILAILEESRALGERPWLVLDIGTGTGGIAAVLAKRHRVISMDVLDQRTTRDGYHFLIGSDHLPFKTDVFDAVLSNHVIEHVTDPGRHLAEIARVLRPGGTCYLATPNRLWPREPHYRTWFTHWLPASWFALLLRRRGTAGESVSLLTWPGLLRCIGTLFTVEVASDRALRHPRRYFMPVSLPVAVLLGAVPAAVHRFLVGLHPTFIILLRKPRGAAERQSAQA